MATQNGFIQWAMYYTKALDYLNILNAEECPSHTKIKKFIDVAKCDFESPKRGRKSKRQPKRKTHNRPGNRQPHNRAFCRRSKGRSDVRQSCLPNIISCKDRSPTPPPWTWQHLQTGISPGISVSHCL